MVVAEIAGAIFTVVSWINSLVGEGWSRYFILLLGLVTLNVVGNFTGLYLLEGAIGIVVSTAFGVQGFFIPIYYGVSSLLILAASAPFIFLLIKMATKT